MGNLDRRIEALEVRQPRGAERLTNGERADRLVKLTAAGLLARDEVKWRADGSPYTQVAEILNRAEERRRNDGQP